MLVEISYEREDSSYDVKKHLLLVMSITDSAIDGTLFFILERCL